MLLMLGGEHQGRAVRLIFCYLFGVGRPTLIRRLCPGLARLAKAQACRRHGSNKQMRNVLLGNQRNTQENKNLTSAGQAQGLRVPSRTLPCPWLTETETETETATATETETETTSVRQCGYKEQLTSKRLTGNLRSVRTETLT